MLSITVELCGESGIVVGSMSMADADRLDMLVRKSMIAGLDAAKGLLDKGHDLEAMRAMLVGDLGLTPNVKIEGLAGTELGQRLEN